MLWLIFFNLRIKKEKLFVLFTILISALFYLKIEDYLKINGKLIIRLKVKYTSIF